MNAPLQIEQASKTSTVWLDSETQAVSRMLELPSDWSSIGADAPSEWVVQQTTEFLSHLAEHNLKPSRISPNVEGGITLVWDPSANDTECRYADVEIFNEGEVLMAVSDVKTPPAVYEIQSGDWHTVIDRLYKWICVK